MEMERRLKIRPSEAKTYLQALYSCFAGIVIALTYISCITYLKSKR